MGGSSFILARQHNGDVVALFEGSNPLPFFWLMLLDKADIDTYKAKILKISGQDTSLIDTSIAINKLDAISCAAKRRDYIKQYYKSCIPLFDDWIYYMQTADFSDMKIYVDLYQACLCYSSPEEFTDSLKRAIICFDEQKEAWCEETIAGTCGYEGKHRNKRRFSESSLAYQKLNQKNIYGGFEKKIHLGKKRSVKKKPLIFVFLTLLLLLIGGLLYYFLK